MEAVWIFSYVLLWVIVLTLALATVVLARQVGVLHSRLPPYGARMTNVGPAIGDQLEPRQIDDLSGRQASLTTPADKEATLLVFITPGCSACTELLPAVRSLSRSDGAALNLVLVSLDGDEATNRSYVETHRLRGTPYVLAPELRLMLGIGSTPYALLLDAQNVVRAKGVANNLEQLASLLTALPNGSALVA